MDPLLVRRTWAIYSDGRAIWLCNDHFSESEHWCAGRFCHTGPAIHKGPLRRVRPFWAPWQTEQWCVRWAVAALNRLTLIPDSLELVKQELADAREVERILESL